MENFALSLFPISLSSLPLHRTLRPGQKTNEPVLIRLQASQRPGAVAREVTLTLSPKPGVEILKLEGASFLSFGADGLKIALPNMGHARPENPPPSTQEKEIDLLLLLEVTTPSQKGTFSPLSLTLRCRLGDASEEQILRADLRVSLQEERWEETDPQVERLVRSLDPAPKDQKAPPPNPKPQQKERAAPTPPPETVPKASLVFINGDRTGEIFSLRAEVTVGRARQNTIVISDPMVAPTHASIRFQEGQFWLLDTKSTFPSRVNGKPVLHYLLKSGDVIDIGLTKMRFEKP